LSGTGKEGEIKSADVHPVSTRAYRKKIRILLAYNIKPVGERIRKGGSENVAQPRRKEEEKRSDALSGSSPRGSWEREPRVGAGSCGRTVRKKKKEGKQTMRISIPVFCCLTGRK